jgi:hypothetical protein
VRSDEAAPIPSNRVEPGFAGADANGFLYLGDENLSIANAAGLRGAPDVSTALSTISSPSTISIFTFGKKMNDIFERRDRISV